ncbi:MAG: NAD(+)/NADH kinase [Candidatus Thermoplasmatota archaeon]|nr:NAD(+)/NADH kinase [Candidatus Thermoplasmatota archaeon]
MQVLLVYKKTHEPVHDHALGHLREVLEGHGGALTVTLRPRELVKQSDFLGRDLVIVLGGDGTLTSISHNIDDATLVMGVNSHPRADDPDGSVGFYMDSDVDTFDNDLRAVLEGSAIVNRLPRLQAVI